MSSQNSDEGEKPQVESIRLTTEEYSRLYEVRKTLWNHGIRGLLYGCSGGLLSSYIVTNYFPQYISPRKIKLQTKRNYLIASCLLGGAFGMLISATVAGRNSFPYIRDIIVFNTKPPTEYSKHMISNEKEIFSEDTFERRRLAIEAQKESKRLLEEEMKKRTY